MDKNPSFHDSCHNRENCPQYDNCPMNTAYKLISGKWKILILWYLRGGALRFSDIKRKLPNVTHKMLTNQLRSLEADGIISRKVYPQVPPKVEYSLTELGTLLSPMLDNMFEFGAKYSKTFKEPDNIE
ncbi:MAG: helix-turn-helix domain-containing protein [Clostridium sp.]|uniref:winged helix-turn-helix transcriptional regulator n=1 Tax=Clostridium sp. TaxID=1506 RepID=UPI002FC94C76